MSAPAFNPNAPSEDVPPFDPSAPSEDVGAPAPEKKSFLREAGGRVADAARGFVENVKNIPSTSWSRVGENLKSLGHPFAEAGREVADEVTHPVRTFQGGPLARAVGLSTPEAERHSDAVNREMVRGVQGNVPLAGLAHEHLTGFPERSEADEAEAPHAAGMGSVGGMAALAAVPSLKPLIGRGLRTALNFTQDAAEVGTAGVKAAVSDVGQDFVKHRMGHGIASSVGATIGGAFGGHTGAAIGAVIPFLPRAVRSAVVAGNEALAAIARRVAQGAETASEYIPPGARGAARAAATHDAEARVIPALGAQPGQRALPPMEAAAAPAAPLEAEVSRAVSPHIKVLEDALAAEKDPEQAQALRASIEGLKAKAEAIKNRVARPAPEPREKLAPSLDERVAAMRAEPLKPKAAEPPAARAEATEPALEAEPHPNISPAEPAKPAWTPSPKDKAHADSLGMPLDKYRDVMARRAERLTKVAGTADFLPLVDKLARAALKVKDPDVFVKEAATAGLSPGHARKIWNAAHKVKAARAAAPAADETEELGL
jgi:hypothetical protein